MSEINLLPWRENKRQQQIQTFKLCLILTVILSISVVIILSYYVNHLIYVQSKRNQLLQSEIIRFEKQIRKIEEIKKIQAILIARMAIGQTLLVNRFFMVQLFDELIKIVPEGVFLSEVRFEKNQVHLSGYAVNNSEVAKLMHNIFNDPWMDNPQLIEIRKHDSLGTEEKIVITENNEFKLSLMINAKKVQAD